ncbi:MAG: DUF1924 domain-containing protein [Gallionellaceae bacterium]|jgi:cytochrome c553|nr:DUF1924 domain-containing protein [Gallionellaceae bacterium]
MAYTTATKICLIALILSAMPAAFADTPSSLAAGYAADAAKASPDFTPSAQRGQTLFTKSWGVSQKMPGCTACHGNDPKVGGKHVVTGKRIDPLAPSTNPERFTSLKKVEKWFKRNCTEVIGRECSAAEKADVIQFISQGS